ATGSKSPPLRYRLCLLPLNRGRKFGVITWAGKQVLGPGSLVGVEVAGREFGEGVGEYTFEAAIPFAAFGLDPRARPAIGVEVASRDHDSRQTTDALPAERCDLSLSGRDDLRLAAAPSRPLQFVGAPRVDAAEPRGARQWWIGALATLGVLGLLVVAGVS